MFETQHVVAIAIAFILGLIFGIAICYNPNKKDDDHNGFFI